MGIESLRHMLAEATDRLKDAGIETARYDARLLFAEACGISPRDIDKALIMGDGFEASDRQLADFRSMMDRRASREPLQYIVGHVPFRYLDLQVGPGVFIPRQETETVVQAGIDWLTREGLYAPKVVDLCAGSGAIGLSIVTEVRGAEVWAVEKFPETLQWTQRNAKRVAGDDPAAGYNYHLEAGDATDTTTLAALDGSVDLVVTNPPYVPMSQPPTQPEVRDYDPEAALYGGSADGTLIPERIIRRSAVLLRDGGALVLEHDITQADRMLTYALSNGFSQARTGLDYTSRPRYLFAVK
ncbi:peptide chain release factor N(5)-glutamine methyltransferase [Bifidobacterium thermophilum]|uniref:peptide chain release factor N(5)-glutamine methyltransferase n=1 Tax=Bifidobacterium thermophilum TaxID=33905 RepID=UPI0030A6CB34